MTDEDPTARTASLEAARAAVAEARAVLDKAMREFAAQLEADGRWRIAEAQRLMGGVAVPGDSPLTVTHPIGTMGTPNMEASSPSAGANISAAKTKGRWPFQRALIKRNLSLPEWARAQKKPNLIEVETAKSWLKKPSKGGRKCPREWADRIEAEFKDERGKSEVPAVNASWPSGIRED